MNPALCVAEFLHEQGVKVFARELLKKLSAARQVSRGETGLRRAKFQRKLAK